MNEYTEDKPLRVFEAFAGYGSQAMALERLSKDYPDFHFKVVGISEIDKYAIQAYEAVHGSVTNYGDITKINASELPEFDLLTYSFPCFPADTLVLTRKRGYVNIQDITTEDEVLTHTNSWRKVLKTMNREYEGNLYSINAMGLEGLSCTENHPFYVRRRYRKGHKNVRLFDKAEWKQAKELTKDYYLGYAINTDSKLPEWEGVENNQWGHHRIIDKLSPLFENPTFWYVMGRYLGDGWKKNSKTGCGIVICCSDRNRLSLYEAIENLGWHATVSQERTATRVIISSNELNAFVDRFGYKAEGKKIDNETLSLPKDLLKGLMEGVMDSDGYVSKEGLHRVSSVSKELIYGLAHCVAKAYNRPFSIYKTKRNPIVVIEDRGCNQRDTYQVSWKESDDKQDHAFYEDGYVWYPINKINHTEAKLTVYNLSVEGDESYTANGCIAHNCTDISVAGQQKGLAEGSGTRSGLLWECRRIIQEKRPKFLLMENVKALTQKKFINEYAKWLAELEGMGYSNYSQVLNAKDYGVPQNRERVFCVSILNNEGEQPKFTFPLPQKLDRRLKDILEDNVPESYYLSEERMKGIKLSSEMQHIKGNGFTFKTSDGAGVATSVTTKAGSRKTDNFIEENERGCKDKNRGC